MNAQAEAIVDRVNKWANKNVPEEYRYNSPMTYFGSALSAGIITRDEYNIARDYKDRLWNYVGD